MRSRVPIRLIALACLSVCPVSYADNTALNSMLEENAAAAAFSRLCGDEPTSDSLKAHTMLLLALSGIEAQSVQLGSAKFNDILRQELRAKRTPDALNCAAKQADASAKLSALRENIAKLRSGN